MKKSNWIVIDTYKDWTLEKNEHKFRIRQGKNIHRQFVGCNGQVNHNNATHYFNVTIKTFF